MERIRDTKSTGITGAGLRAWGMLFLTVGIVGKCILQNRLLNLASVTPQQLLEAMQSSNAVMLSAPMALGMQALDTCAVPVFAFLPMFIIWVGIGEASKIALIAYATFIPMLIYIENGIRDTDPLLIRSAKSLGATDHQIFTKVILNSALPTIFDGMKISLALTFSALVVAEMMGADKGLGYIIVNAKNWFKMGDMFLAATLIGLEYSVFYAFLSILEKKLFRWKNVNAGKAVEK